MSTTGHENEAINVQGLKASLQKFKDDYVTDVAYLEEGEGSAAIADFDPQTDTVWKKAQTLSNAEKAQVKTNLGLPNEVYSKTEVNELVSTPHQNYVTVSTYAELPASGSTDTIYRVSNYDGTQVAAGVYSEYAWSGSAYVFLAAKSSVGEVFDISEYHAGTKYANLAAALDSNNGGGVPQSLQKGGMSVKYVSNTDNKYIQARCMAQNFTTDTTQWQGVDNQPTAGSQNLVKSGGVADAFETVAVSNNLELNNILREVYYKTEVLDKSDLDNVYVCRFYKAFYREGVGYQNGLVFYIGTTWKKNYTLLKSYPTREAALEAAQEKIFIQTNSTVEYGWVIDFDKLSEGTTDIGGYIFSIFDNIDNIQYSPIIQNYINSEKLVTDEVPTIGSNNVVKSGGVADKSFLVSKHKHAQREITHDWEGDIYQNDKLYSVFCELNKAYKGYSIRIIQMGWLEPVKKFFFGARLYKNGTYKNAVNFAVEYNSIPLTDERYKCDLYDGENKIGSLSFMYNWSKINGDTSNHLLNDTADQYDNYHIEISNISFSYNEIEPTFNPEDYFTKNETKNLVEETFTDAGIIVGEKNTYGRKDSYAYDGHFPTNENLVVTIKNSNVQKSGLLQSLTINVYTSGKFKIGIGHMDQRGWYLEVGSFDIETTETGYITLDLRSKLIYIPKDEQIFIYCGHYGDETIAFNAGAETNGFFYGPANGALSYYPDGGKCTIQYEVQETESTYAGKTELEKTNENVANANTIATTALNNNFKVKDRAGNLYKLLVVNGVLRALPMQYSNVLVIGNSLCEHPQTEDYGGWHASGRGMASSVVGNDYCGILQTALRRTSPSAVVTRNTNFTSWFRNPTDLSNAKFAELFNGVLSNNYDLVVFRLSENNNVHIDLMKDAIVALINYVWSQLPNCDAIITSDVMDGNADKNAQLSAAAVELDVPYINALCADRVYKYADVNWSYAPYYYQGDDMNLYPIQRMFSSHINDYGMLKVANAILSGIGYSPIELAHNVIVNTSVDYMAQAQGVENGIITVLLYGNAPQSYTVVDANGNTIQATLHDMSNISYYSAPDRVPTYAITFVMPTSDVTISIS